MTESERDKLLTEIKQRHPMGQVLLEARVSLGFGLREFAEDARIPPGRYCDIEKTGEATRDEWKQIALTLHERRQDRITVPLRQLERMVGVFRALVDAATAPEAQGAACECATWATELVVSGHHVNCGRFNPRPFIEAIHKLLDGMEYWAADEDGIHPDAWEAYRTGCGLVCRVVRQGDEDCQVAPAAIYDAETARADAREGE